MCHGQMRLLAKKNSHFAYFQRTFRATAPVALVSAATVQFQPLCVELGALSSCAGSDLLQGSKAAEMFSHSRGFTCHPANHPPNQLTNQQASLPRLPSPPLKTELELRGFSALMCERGRPCVVTMRVLRLREIQVVKATQPSAGIAPRAGLFKESAWLLHLLGDWSP